MQKRCAFVVVSRCEVLMRRWQLLTYYELDLGLNHVVRKWSEPTDPRANLLVSRESPDLDNFLKSS
jgi:hypothetical protein